MLKCFSIKVSGKVQGVFYRASAKEQADLLRLKGLVKNERNGDVYIEAEGEEEILKRFVAWCHRGPQRARVDQVQVNELPLKNFVDFSIQR